MPFRSPNRRGEPFAPPIGVLGLLGLLAARDRPALLVTREVWT